MTASEPGGRALAHLLRGPLDPDRLGLPGEVAHEDGQPARADEELVGLAAEVLGAESAGSCRSAS